MTFRDIEAFNGAKSIASIELIASEANAIAEKLRRVGPPVQVLGTSRTISASDFGVLLYTTNVSPVTITVPTNISSDTGVSFSLLNYGSGKVEIRGGSNVMVRSSVGTSSNNVSGNIFLRTNISMATVFQITANNWVVVGDIASS